MAEDAASKYAIHEACRDGHTQKAEALLANNPKLATLRDQDDRLPLHWAASYNHVPILQLVLTMPKFDVDATDASGWTALMMASSRRGGDGEDMAKLLLSLDADANAKNNAGQTALHLAASKANTDIVRMLIAAKASARVKDKRGVLPLHRAAAVGSVPVMKILLEARSPLDATDMDGWTALHHAVSEGHGDAALLLLTRGALFDKKDPEGRTALDVVPDAKTRKFLLQAAEREGLELE